MRPEYPDEVPVRVRCIATYPNAEQIEKLGICFYEDQTFHLSVGREYIVFGLRFEVDSEGMGTGPWVDLISDYGHLSSAPLYLFEITDGRVSRYWDARLW